MSKVLRCDALVSGCDFEARGSEDEILAAAGRHAKEDHGLEISDGLVEKVKSVIRDE